MEPLLEKCRLHRANAPTTPPDGTFCFFHQTGEAARQSCQPCNWLGNETAAGPPIEAAANNDLLFLSNTVFKRSFLVDLGAEVSVMPATGLEAHTQQTGPPLLAAKGSKIKTYALLYSISRPIRMSGIFF